MPADAYVLVSIVGVPRNEELVQGTYYNVLLTYRSDRAVFSKCFDHVLSFYKGLLLPLRAISKVHIKNGSHFCSLIQKDALTRVNSHATKCILFKHSCLVFLLLNKALLLYDHF
jgi:hypothetical protein